jgi:DNA-binding transcriptional MocR family regulator
MIFSLANHNCFPEVCGMGILRILSASQQVAEHLRSELLSGRWVETMPGEDKLIAHLGVGRATVQAGFKQTIEKERASQFFRVRLWNRDDLITNLLASYDQLDEEVRNKLPLKRLWCVSAGGAE